MRAATILVLAAAIGLAGCAAMAPPPAASNTPFDILGRVAVNFDGRAFSSNVRWQHDAAREEVWLLTPLGQTIAHIVSDSTGATLTGADQQQYRAANVESLTRQALGWELPLSRLTWWVRGEAVPASPPASAERDDRSRLTLLDQDGWRIAFVNYPPGEHGGLPRRLDLKSGSQEIRFLIDGWREVDAAR
ncbi:MAG TPA: lipoprotein insertase outer membrane protein LolB [Burkholderiales bacterium]|nr:lipoprotein insertase outer membrane protein LolB [Burkholderiales bacterium]